MGTKILDMQSSTTVATADFPASNQDDVPNDGTVVLVIGMVALTVLAGLGEVIQRSRSSEVWPVPLVIYCTLLPVVTFILVAAKMLGEGLSLLYLAAAFAPLPLIIVLRLLRPRTGEAA